MAQGRGGRGIANLVTSGVLLLFGALGFTAGCSAGETDGTDVVGESTEAAVICSCPKPPNPCMQYTCVGTTCVLGALKDGTACQDTAPDGTAFRGRCLEALCCPGCVYRDKSTGGAYACAARGGTESARCGVSGEYCANCNNDACLTGACVNRACEPVPEGKACTNTTGACHNGSCCQGCLDANDQCVAGGDVSACGVSTDQLVKCQNCDDGNDCNGKDTCTAGSCQTGAPPDCDDQEVCTDDSCSANGCEHKPRTGADCNDGDPCTTKDKCGDDGKCGAGTPIKCDDGEFCTDDSCKDGVCVYAPIANNTPCTDPDMCTSNDKCVDGLCKGTSSTGVDCNDDNVCTADSLLNCNSTICQHLPQPLSQACPAPDKCHADGHCSGTDGKCVAGPAKNCDDGNPCTKDSCDPETGCVNVNDPTAACSDGDPCTENDACEDGKCHGTPQECEPLDACHEAGSCDKTTGTCNDPRSEDGKACPGGSCLKGACVLDPNANPGAGGETAGGAGPGAGGEAPGSGGAGSGPGPTGEAGQGENPGEAGTGGSTTTEEPERPFVRNPQGCSCDLPGTAGGQRSASLVALGLLAGIALRRSRREQRAA